VCPYVSNTYGSMCAFDCMQRMFSLVSFRNLPHSNVSEVQSALRSELSYKFSSQGPSAIVLIRDAIDYIPRTLALFLDSAVLRILSPLHIGRHLLCLLPPVLLVS